MKKAALCGVVYEGPSVPDAHGTRCAMPKGHDKGPSGAARHFGHYRGKPISWWTPEQKAALTATMLAASARSAPK